MIKSLSKPLFLLTLLVSTSTWSQNAMQDAVNTKASKDWSIVIRNTTTTNMYSLDSVNHQASNRTRFDFNLNMPGGRIGINSTLVKDFQGERKQQLTDFRINFVKPAGKIGKYINVVHFPILTIPTSENSDKRANLTTQLTYVPFTSIDGAMFGSKNLSVLVIPYVVKAFHKYTTTTLGTSNNEWLVGINPIINYSITDKFMTGPQFSYARSWTYLGNSEDSYNIGWTATLSFMKTWTAMLGYEVGGSPLAANGRSNQIDVTNLEQANMFLELATRF